MGFDRLHHCALLNRSPSAENCLAGGSNDNTEWIMKKRSMITRNPFLSSFTKNRHSRRINPSTREEAHMEFFLSPCFYQACQSARDFQAISNQSSQSFPIKRCYASAMKLEAHCELPTYPWNFRACKCYKNRQKKRKEKLRWVLSMFRKVKLKVYTCSLMFKHWKKFVLAHPGRAESMCQPTVLSLNLFMPVCPCLCALRPEKDTKRS